MHILITGGSGFLGTALTHALKNNGIDATAASVTWVSRTPAKAQQRGIADAVISYDELARTDKAYEVIINLAGAGIADSRWTDARKQVLFDSRLQPTQALVDYIARIGNKPKLLVSGSAVGWYGAQDTNDPTALTESHAPVKADFAHEICDAWEKLALSVQGIVPVAIVRTGVVIDPAGGMVARLVTPFKLAAGGKLGNGKQVMSWISRRDWVRAVMFIIAHHLRQPLNSQPIYNLTNPKPVTNAEFTDAMGQWLHRPTVATMPAVVVKLLFGDMATLLLDGQKVVPQALLTQGFSFEQHSVLAALQTAQSIYLG